MIVNPRINMDMLEEWLEVTLSRAMRIISAEWRRFGLQCELLAELGLLDTVKGIGG
jgi:hypothetical protein